MMKLSLPTLSLLLGLGLAPISLRAQTPAEPPPETPTLQEEIRVNLLQVPILATDRNNNPIIDLRPEEIVLKVAGDAVDVAFLDAFVPEASPADPLPDVRLRVDLPGGSEAIVNSTGEVPRHVIFYIDVENDQPLGKSRATAQLVRFVREELDPAARAAVLSFNGEVNIETPFTSDRRIISDAIREGFDRPPRPQIDLRLRIRRLLDEIDDCVYQNSDFLSRGSETCTSAVALQYADEVRPRAYDYLRGLEGIVNFASGLAGRKSVLAITHGVAVEPAQEIFEAVRAILGDTIELNQLYVELLAGEGHANMMDDLLEQAVRNEVTLHFLDRTTPPAGVSTASSGRTYTPGSQPIQSAFKAAQADAGQMAAITGGIFLHNEDLGAAVKAAVDAERGAYQIGAYLDRYLPKDRLSKLSIKSTRKGVRIRHSRGTYAESTRPGARDLLRGRIALGQPQKVPTGADRIKIPFQVAADARDLGYSRHEDLAVASFTVHVQLQTIDGRTAADAFHLLDHAYPWKIWAQESMEPVLIDGWVEVPRGSYRLVANFSNPRRDVNAKLERDINVASRPQAPPAAEAPPGDGR